MFVDSVILVGSNADAPPLMKTRKKAKIKWCSKKVSTINYWRVAGYWAEMVFITNDIK